MVRGGGWMGGWVWERWCEGGGLVHGWVGGSMDASGWQASAQDEVIQTEKTFADDDRVVAFLFLVVHLPLFLLDGLVTCRLVCCCVRDVFGCNAGLCIVTVWLWRWFLAVECATNFKLLTARPASAFPIGWHYAPWPLG